MHPNVFTVRASSWGRLFDCAHAWEGTHILGMRKASGMRAAAPPSTPARPPMTAHAWRARPARRTMPPAS